MHENIGPFCSFAVSLLQVGVIPTQKNESTTDKQHCKKQFVILQTYYGPNDCYNTEPSSVYYKTDITPVSLRKYASFLNIRALLPYYPSEKGLWYYV